VCHQNGAAGVAARVGAPEPAERLRMVGQWRALGAQMGLGGPQSAHAGLAPR
jgi:hypothetical protein